MPVEKVVLDKVRLGGRNYLRVDDPVEVAPRRPGCHDGYVGVVKKITQISGDIEYVEVEVYGAPGNKAPAHRAYRLDRLSRTRQQPTHRVMAEKRAAARENA